MLKSTVVERRVDCNLTSTLALLCCGVAGWTKGNKLGSEVTVHPAVTGVVLPAAAVNRINIDIYNCTHTGRLFPRRRRDAQGNHCPWKEGVFICSITDNYCDQRQFIEHTVTKSVVPSEMSTLMGISPISANLSCYSKFKYMYITEWWHQSQIARTKLRWFIFVSPI